MTIFKLCTVCSSELGKGNVTGRCIAHGRWTKEKVLLPPRRQKTKVFLRDWCPVEWQEEARRLNKSIKMPEVKRIIESEIAANEKKRLSTLTPFERQMEKVRNGASLVAKFEPNTQYNVTLGGVSSI